MDGSHAIYLTSYLKNGLIDQAQTDSRVFIPFDIDSWSGYITVGAEASCHLFFWYFHHREVPAPRDQLNTTQACAIRLLIWLNGGPGISSMVGLFEEIGPLKADSKGTVTKRNIAWTDQFDVLFIDNPVNTGFSFHDTGHRTKSVKETADHLYEFIIQFVQLYQDAKFKELYIGGQSYGGKYVPEFAALVKKDGSFNLKGIYIGSGLFEPSLMLPLYPDFLEAVGILSEVKAEEMRDEIKQHLVKFHTDPQEALMALLNCIFVQLKKLRGVDDTDNILCTEKPPAWTSELYLNQPEVQRAIHVKSTKYVNINEGVIMDMAEDFTKGVQGAFQSLLESGIKVLVFNGQMDPIVSVGMTEKFLSSLSWSGNQSYQTGDKMVWRNGAGRVAGYVTQTHNLTRVVICNAGHRTAIDQPACVLDMMKRFIYNLSFDGALEC